MHGNSICNCRGPGNADRCSKFGLPVLGMLATSRRAMILIYWWWFSHKNRNWKIVFLSFQSCQQLKGMALIVTHLYIMNANKQHGPAVHVCLCRCRVNSAIHWAIWHCMDCIRPGHYVHNRLTAGKDQGAVYTRTQYVWLDSGVPVRPMAASAAHCGLSSYRSITRLVAWHW